MPRRLRSRLVLGKSKVLPADFPLRIDFHTQRSDEIPHGHEFHELVLVRFGGGLHRVGEVAHPIQRGDLFLIQPGQAHTYEAVDRLRIVNCLYDPQALGLPLWDLPEVPGWHPFFETGPRLRGEGRRHAGLHLEGDDFSGMEALLSHMERIQRERGPGWKHAMATEWMRVLASIARLRAEVPGNPLIDKVSQLLRYLEAHLDESWHQAELASYAGVSVSTLQRLFRDSLGQSPMEALGRLRLERAERLLRNTRDSVASIARAVGINDGNYLSKRFREAYQSSPRVWRRKMSPQPPSPLLSGGKRGSWEKRRTGAKSCKGSV